MIPENRRVRVELAVLLGAVALWAGDEVRLRLRAWRAGASPFRVATAGSLIASDRNLNHVMRPDLDLWAPADSDEAAFVRFRTDGLGFHTPPVLEARTPGVPRVILTGACSMQELGIGTPEGYGPCATRLSELLGHAEVLNAAVGGYDLPLQTAQYDFKLNLLRPDVLVAEVDTSELFNRPDHGRDLLPGANHFDVPPLLKVRNSLLGASLALDALVQEAPAREAALRKALGLKDPPAEAPVPRDRPWAEAFCEKRLGLLAATLRRDGVRLLVQAPTTWLRSPGAEACLASGPWSDNEKARFRCLAGEARDFDAALEAWCEKEGVPLVPARDLPSNPADFLVVKGFRSPYTLNTPAQCRRADALAAVLKPLLEDARAGR